jgi:hypothetical protein
VWPSSTWLPLSWLAILAQLLFKLAIDSSLASCLLAALRSFSSEKLHISNLNNASDFALGVMSGVFVILLGTQVAA